LYYNGILATKTLLNSCARTFQFSLLLYLLYNAKFQFYLRHLRFSVICYIPCFLEPAVHISLPLFYLVVYLFAQFIYRMSTVSDVVMLDTLVVYLLLLLFVLHFRNIFLRCNMVKIGDFGISRILMSNSEMATTFVGTPYYMSPEVLKHDGYNSKSDIW